MKSKLFALLASAALSVPFLSPLSIVAASESAEPAIIATAPSEDSTESAFVKTAVVTQSYWTVTATLASGSAGKTLRFNEVTESITYNSTFTVHETKSSHKVNFIELTNGATPGGLSNSTALSEAKKAGAGGDLDVTFVHHTFTYTTN